MGFFIMKNILKVVFVIVGTLIGAGFASGQEMYLFFFSYGIKGLFGILISSLLMGFIIYKTLILVKQHNVKNYKEFLEIFFKNKNSKLKDVINIIINTFILITFFIMVAGFGAYFGQEWGINSLVGSILLASVSFMIFMTNIKGVVKTNEILVPILIAFITIIGIINLKDINLGNLEHYLIRTNQSSYIISAILYCSYNSILLIPVLITIKEYCKNKQQISIISIITSVVIFLLLIRVDVDITKLEMPAVYVVSNMFKILKIIYGFIILGSIFTTTISLGSSFLQNTSKNKNSYTQIALIMCITSVLVSKIGFSNLINLLYPTFGYLGIIQILLLIRK